MEYQFTEAARRALDNALRWSGIAGSAELETPALLLGLLTESECRAALLLKDGEIDIAAVFRRWPELASSQATAEEGSARSVAVQRSGDLSEVTPRISREITISLAAAAERLTDHPQPLTLATEHLLLGLVAAEHEVADWLRRQGAQESVPLPRETNDASVATRTQPQTQVEIVRLFDAAANRAREGLRVVEDYVRFVLNDSHLTARLKALRHDLTSAVSRVPMVHRLAARETQADVGTRLETPAERVRPDTTSVLAANFARLQEGLRSLEEFGKILDPPLASQLEQLRYQTYTLHRAVDITRTSLQRLARARLYVLVDGRASIKEFESLAGTLVGRGVHVVQLRDKRLDDRELLLRARRLRELTLGKDTLFIMNDRPDLAVLSGADGVHVGQEEVTVKDARTIVGPEALVGVSTHSVEQARAAVLDGANYIGVGPTFPSGTKHFDEFPGVELLRAVAAEIRLPAFAIGGITSENLTDVLATGISRVAVSGAVTTATEPGRMVSQLLAELAP